MLKPRHSELQHTINEKLLIEEAPPQFAVTQLETLFLLSLSEMRLHFTVAALPAQRQGKKDSATDP